MTPAKRNIFELSVLEEDDVGKREVSVEKEFLLVVIPSKGRKGIKKFGITLYFLPVALTPYLAEHSLFH